MVGLIKVAEEERQMKVNKMLCLIADGVNYWELSAKRVKKRLYPAVTSFSTVSYLPLFITAPSHLNTQLLTA